MVTEVVVNAEVVPFQLARLSVYVQSWVRPEIVKVPLDALVLDVELTPSGSAQPVPDDTSIL